MRTMKTLGAAIFLLMIAPSLLAAGGEGIKYLTPVDSTDPTINFCTAYRSTGQKCKECTTTTRVDGSTYGACYQRNYSSSCTCTTGAPSCQTQGSCTYSNY